ncbi:uncharacterized protein M6B38_339125 [Iris pallida]|nr:uncharacterized protein M6B38_339125 [Iris pallida]
MHISHRGSSRQLLALSVTGQDTALTNAARGSGSAYSADQTHIR